MASEYFWISIENDDSIYTAACIVDEMHDGSDCIFEEFGSQRRINGLLDHIVDSIVNAESTLTATPENLVNADDVSENAVLWYLKQKFQKDIIYSSVGGILIALNPYKCIEGYYDSETLNSYINELPSIVNTLSPHIWGIARDSYLQLAKQGRRQAIIISGESGAGKTEATKRIMQYLSTVSMNQAALAATHTADEAIEEKILKTNPLLESFGNAKTCRNDNSSRFGKWLEIVFDMSVTLEDDESIAEEGKEVFGSPRLIGAHITHYLLEKSRVVGHSAGERNFHIFYQLCASPEHNMQAPEKYAYLQGDTTSINSVNDGEALVETLRSFDDLKMQPELRVAMLDVLKGILHLGNVDFEVNDNEEALVTASTQESLTQAATYLSLEPERLGSALISQSMAVGKEVVLKNLNKEQATNARNALAKEIYARTFACMVELANASLDPPPLEKDKGSRRSIGLLDIFGFEIFEINTLEQLCINFANEKLQQHFLQFVLKQEQDIYEREGVEHARIFPQDNEDVISMLEMPKTGLFNYLDEEIRLPKGNDAGFLRKVSAANEEKEDRFDEEGLPLLSRFLQDLSMRKDQFAVVHFAGRVVYDVEGFVEKNKDRLSDTMYSLLCSSQHEPSLRILSHTTSSSTAATIKASEKGGAEKTVQSQYPTLTKGFSRQLDTLMTVLTTSNPHFVRCIKPNHDKLPGLSNDQVMMDQLRYSGVLEAVHIRKEGYPVRRSHKLFLYQYTVLSSYTAAELRDFGVSIKECVDIVVEDLVHAHVEELLEGLVVGESLVLMKQAAWAHLEALKEVKRSNLVLVMQCGVRVFSAKRRVSNLKEVRMRIRALVEECDTKRVNYMLADPLSKCLHYYTTVLRGVPYAGSIQAHERLEQLSEVQELMHRANYLCSEESSAEIDDPAVEYTKITALRDEIKAFGIEPEDSIELAILMEREKKIRRKARALLHLRAALDSCNEDAIRDALEQVAEARGELEQEDGDTSPSTSFFKSSGPESPIVSPSKVKSPLLFVKEETLAKDLLTGLQQETASIIALVDSVQSLAPSGLLDRGSDWSDDRLSEVVAAATTQQEVVAKQPPQGRCAKTLVDFSQHVCATAQAYKVGEWRELGDALSRAAVVASELDAQSQVEEDWGVSPPVMTVVPAALMPTVKKALALFKSIREKCASKVEEEVLCPSLRSALDLGRVKLVPDVLLEALIGTEDYAALNKNRMQFGTVDFESLESTQLQHALVGLQSWYPWMTKPALHVLQQCDILVHVRHYLLEGNWELVLWQSGGAAETGVLINLLFKTWDDCNGASGDKLGGFPFSMGAVVAQLKHVDVKTPLVPFKACNTSLVSEDTFPLASVKEEISLGRKEALMQIMHKVVVAIVTIGRFVGCAGNIEIERVKLEKGDDGNETEKVVISDRDLNQSVGPVDAMLQELPALAHEVPELNFLRHPLQQLSDLRKLLSKDPGDAKAAQQAVDLSRDKQFRLVNVEVLLQSSVDDNNFTSGYMGVIYEETSLLLCEARDRCVRSLLCEALNRDAFDGRATSSQTASLKQSLQTARELETLPDGGNQGLALSAYASGLLYIADFLCIARDSFSNLLSKGGKQAEEAALRQQCTESVRSIIAKIAEMSYDAEDVGSTRAPGLSEISRIWLESVSLLELASELDVMLKYVALWDHLAQVKRYLCLPSPVEYTVAVPVQEQQLLMQETTTREPRYVLLQDGFDFNNEVLETGPMEAAADAASGIVAGLGAAGTSTTTESLLHGAKVIASLRKSVRVGNWVQAYQIFKQINTDGTLDRISDLHQEIVDVAPTVKNYYIISRCRKGLLTGAPKGPVGIIDGSKAEVAHLDDIIHECAEIGVSSPRAQDLRDCVVHLASLRNAIIHSNWTQLKTEVQHCLEKEIGARGSTTEFCYDEVHRAKLEVLNHDCIRSLNQGLIVEQVSMSNGLLNAGEVSVDRLTQALSETSSVKESHRGVLLVEIMSLADIVLKARKAIMHSNWFALTSITNLWKQEAANFKSCVEQLEVEDDVNAIQQHLTERKGSQFIRKNSVLSNSNRRMSRRNSTLSERSSGTEEDNEEPAKPKVRNLWPTLGTLYDSMMGELLLIEQHFMTLEIETKIHTALREGGVTADMLGNVDTSKIDTENIESALIQFQSMLDKGMTLDPQLENVFDCAKLILTLRKTILAGKWNDIINLLEDMVMKGNLKEGMTMPDMCRKELELTRHEAENNWIIKNLREAIEEGACTGDLDDVNLGFVTYDHLVACISSCKEMTPRTDSAKKLIYTAEVMVPLRRLLRGMPKVDWYAVRTRALDVLSSGAVGRLDTSVLGEIKFIENLAADMILCDTLQKALQKDGPKGTPGNLDLSTVSVADLSAGCLLAINDAVKTERAKRLLIACRSVKALREALLRTEAPTEEESEASWSTMRAIISKMYETYEAPDSAENSFDSESSSPLSPPPASPMSPSPSQRGRTASYDSRLGKAEKEVNVGWAACKDEVALLSQHAHVVDIKKNLIYNIKSAIKVYDKRAAGSLKLEEEKMSKRSQHAGYQQRLVGQEENLLDIESLEDLNTHIASLDFKVDLLATYAKIAKKLKQLRKCVNTFDWQELHTASFDEYCVSLLSDFPEGAHELAMVQRECKIMWSLYLLSNSIRAEDIQANLQQSVKLFLARFAPESTITETPAHFSPVQELLYESICVVKLGGVSIAAVTRFLECAMYVLQLRVGLAQDEHEQVSQSLEWIQEWSSVCPVYVQEEAKRAYGMHQNEILRTNVIKACRNGQIRPPQAIRKDSIEDVKDPVSATTAPASIQKEYAYVETETLSSVIATSQRMGSSHILSAEVGSLVTAAADLLALREAMKTGNMVGLHDYLSSMRERSKSLADMQGRRINKLIIGEVAATRTVLNNEISKVALKCACISFYQASKMDLPSEFADAVQLSADDLCNNDLFLSIVGNTKFFEAKRYAQHQYKGEEDARMNERSYSYENMYHIDLDAETISSEMLHEALEIARKHGVHCAWARRLQSTVTLLITLRQRMCRLDWSQVRNDLTLAGVPDDKTRSHRLDIRTMPATLDPVCALELHAIKAQLEIRVSIIDLRAALKTGWAHCCNGIVDTSPLEIEQLEQKLLRCRASVNLGDQLPMTRKANDQGVAEFKSSSGEVTARRMSLRAGSGAHEQIMLLLSSTGIVLEVRRMLKEGEIIAAGRKAHEVITQSYESLHWSVLAECQFYDYEIYCARELSTAIITLRKTILSDSKQSLDATIRESIDKLSDSPLRFHDLGLLNVIQKAMRKSDAVNRAHSRLRKCIHSYDTASVKQIISMAKKLLGTNKDVIDKAQMHLERLEEFEQCFSSHTDPARGGLQDLRSLREVVETAKRLKLSLHPQARYAEVLQHMGSNSSMCTHVADALANSSAYKAATETMRLKRSYLKSPSARTYYALENFPNLRDPKSFGLRNNLTNTVLVDTMLVCTDQALPTSLTKLGPQLVALSVWIFNHAVRGIGTGIYTHPEVMLRNLLKLGRCCPQIRDEVLLQCVKQLRNNTDPARCQRLWRLLSACLSHFPPSRLLESYLELWLIDEAERHDSLRRQAEETAAIAAKKAQNLNSKRKMNAGLLSGMSGKVMSPKSPTKRDKEGEEGDAPALTTGLAQSSFPKLCVRLMHEAVFQFGYAMKIHKEFDISLHYISQWLTAEDIDRLRCRPPQPVDVNPASIGRKVPHKKSKQKMQDREDDLARAQEQQKNRKPDLGWEEAPHTLARSPTGGDTVSGPLVGALFASVETTKESNHRPLLKHVGTHSYWAERYYKFAGGETTLVPKEVFVRRIAMLSFRSVHRPCTKEVSYSVPLHCNSLEEELLFYLVTGQPITRPKEVLRRARYELTAHFGSPYAKTNVCTVAEISNVLMHSIYFSPAENMLCRKRFLWLVNHVRVPEPEQEASLSEEDKVRMATTFWDNVVVPIQQLSKAGGLSSDDTLTVHEMEAESLGLKMRLYRDLALAAMYLATKQLRMESEKADDKNR